MRAKLSYRLDGGNCTTGPSGPMNLTLKNTKMKLQSELKNTECLFSELAKKYDIQDYIETVRKSGRFNNLKTRIAWDILKSVMTTSEICAWYKKYDCDDTHITTLAIKALESLKLKF